MQGITYKKLKLFLDKYPHGVSWRVKRHCSIIDKHLNPDEELLYVFAGQYDNITWSLCNTVVVAITSERLILGQKYILPGYKFVSITPDLYNDLSVYSGIFWGTIAIDTIKEIVYVSDLDKASLPEVETVITEFMTEKKKEYAQLGKPNSLWKS